MRRLPHREKVGERGGSRRSPEGSDAMRGAGDGSFFDRTPLGRPRRGVSSSYPTLPGRPKAGARHLDSRAGRGRRDQGRLEQRTRTSVRRRGIDS